MSHSVYDNSPFDSNHDGHISVGEASFIHDTYHKDSNIGIKSGNRDHLNNHKRNTGNSGKNNRMKYILIALLVVMVPVIFIMAARFYNEYSAQKRDEEFDLARNDFKKTVETPGLYTNINELIKSVEVICEFKDERFSQYTDYQNNQEFITVYMDDSIEGMDEEDKCSLFSSIIFDIREKTMTIFNESRYRKLFDERKIAFSMDYKGREIEIYHKCEVWDFCFITSGKKYSIEVDRYKSYDGRYILRDYDIAKDKSELYLFSYDYQYGTISEFEDKAKYDTKEERSTELKKATQSYKSLSSEKASTYDPYDVQDYKSAQDFADDKYEDFYDYEDDYEDEDEAYDAAEEYWDEHH